MPKIAHADLVNLKNKTAEKLAAYISSQSAPKPPITPTSQPVPPQPPLAISNGFTSSKIILFLLTFFGLLAFILWLTSPSSSDETAENVDNDDATLNNNNNKSNLTSSSSSLLGQEDEDQLNDPSTSSNNRSSRGGLVRRRSDRSNNKQSSRYQIDTIYESLAESSVTYEEKRRVVITSDFDVVTEDAPQNNNSNNNEKLIRQTREELIRTIQQQQHQRQLKISGGVDEVGGVELERSSGGAGSRDFVDRILDDLVTDEMEQYAYNKHDRKALLAKQDSLNNKNMLSDSNESKNESSGSQNSLLSTFNFDVYKKKKRWKKTKNTQVVGGLKIFNLIFLFKVNFFEINTIFIKIFAFKLC